MSGKSAILDMKKRLIYYYLGYGEHVLKNSAPVKHCNYWNGGILKLRRRMVLKRILDFIMCTFLLFCFVSYR